MGNIGVGVGVNLGVNVGCGQTPTNGFRNFDNSLSIRLSQIPLLPAVLEKLGVLNQSQTAFMRFARTHSIEYGDVVKGLPLPSGAIDVLYSSHMFEHLDQHEAVLFLKEARRLLRPGGTLRLAVPDMRIRLRQYLDTNDSDAFIESTYMTLPRASTLPQRVREFLLGTRQHRWMYDGNSLSRLLLTQGFLSPRILKPGESQISHPHNLDLHERASDSVYVEAINP